MKRILYVLMFLGGAVGCFFAVSFLWWQDRANRVFVPVEARVVSAEVKRHSGKNTSYSPEITYHYRYGEREYTSSQVLTVKQSSSRTWATGIVNRFGGETGGNLPEIAERKTTAYVDPENPSDAILVREYSFVPYALTVAAGFVSLLGLGLLVGVVGGGRKKMMAVPLDETEARLLMPEKSLRKQSIDAFLWVIATGAIGLPVAAHWAIVVHGGWSVLSLMIAGGVAVLGVIAFMRWTLTRHMSDARLTVSPAPLVRGRPMTLKVESDVFTALKVAHGRMRVVCTEHYKEKSGNKTRYGTRVRGERVVEYCTGTELAAGNVLAGSGEVFVGQDLPPTTDLTVTAYPYYTWEVRVEIAIAQHADYYGVFPLEVD